MEWREELKEAITDIETLKTKGFQCDHEESSLPFRVTPHLLSIMESDTSHCPVGRQFVPQKGESEILPGELIDPVCEEPLIMNDLMVTAYPDRALFIVNGECPTYCRFCFRKRRGGVVKNHSKDDYAECFQKLKENPQIQEVILSGGEPLLMSDDWLGWFLEELNTISSVKVIRVHSRILTSLPSRITNSIVKVFKEGRLLYFHSHFNHYRELTPKSLDAARKLREAGIIVANHSVLLRGINDEPETMRHLCLKLYQNGILPYYLFHCDCTPGNAAYRTTIANGVALHRKLQGWISGGAVPAYRFDAPAIRKIPLNSNYVNEIGKGVYQLTNYKDQKIIYDEGKLFLSFQSVRSSVIIPVYREGEEINRLLLNLKEQGFDEVIVVDGEPDATTIKQIKTDGIIKIHSEKGRGRQLIAGAKEASGKILFFLHADSSLPEDSVALIVRAIDNGADYGAFRLKVASKHFRYRLAEFMVFLRSRFRKIPYGDQGIFFKRTFYAKMGGFKPLPLMEDLELMDRCCGEGSFCLLSRKISTSARRWEKVGFVKTTLLNWHFRRLFRAGVPIDEIYQRYYGK